MISFLQKNVIAYNVNAVEPMSVSVIKFGFKQMVKDIHECLFYSVSNWRATETLPEYLEKRNVIGICR